MTEVRYGKKQEVKCPRSDIERNRRSIVFDCILKETAGQTSSVGYRKKQEVKFLRLDMKETAGQIS